MKFSGIIFDGDGTLFDSEELTNIGFRRIMAERGVHLERADTVPLMGVGPRNLLPEVKRLWGVDFTLEEFRQRREIIYREVCEEFGGPFPMKGVFENLQWLIDHHVPIALATGASPEKMIFNLEQTNLFDFFQVQVSGHDVENDKPAPDIYHLTAEKLGIEISKSLIVEDTIPGLEGGKNAGATVAAVEGTHTRDELKQHSELVFADHFEMLHFFQENVEV